MTDRLASPRPLRHRAADALRSPIAPLRRRLATDAFLSNVSRLFATVLFGQAITLLASPVLTRLYTPEEFGVLGVYAGLLTVLVSLAALRYETALPIARSEREALDLLALCGLVLMVTAGVVVLAAFILPATLFARIGLRLLVPYRLLIPVGFTCLGAYAALFSFAIRDGSYDAIARTRIGQALSGPFTQIAFGVAGAGAGGLLVGFIVAQSAGTLLLLRPALARARARRHAVSIRALADVAHQFRNFPLFSSWGAVIGAAGTVFALYVLVGAFYSGTVAGYLFLSQRVVGRPLNMIVTSLAPVYLGEAGRLVYDDPSRLRRRFLQVTSRHFLFAASWILAVNIVASWLYPRVFGPQWAGAVPYLRALSVWFICSTVVNIVAPTLQVLQRQILASTMQVLGPGCGVIAFVLCYYRGLGASQAVWAYCLCQALAFVVTFVLMVRALETAPRGDAVRRIG